MKTLRRAILSGLAALALVFQAPSGASALITDLPAAQLRIALDHVLAEHAYLLAEMMRTGVGHGDDFATAARSLEGNTVQLVGAIDSVYGSAAAAAFGQQWRNHIAFLVDYTRALAYKDSTAQTLASDQLNAYVISFSELLAGANPNLPEKVVEGLIQEHVEELKQVAAFNDANYGDAYPGIHRTYEHMFTIGDALAGGIAAQFPDRFSGASVAFGPAMDLRIALDRLLGEHTMLSALAMRAGLSGAGNADAVTAALGQNSAALADWIGQIYGAEAKASFIDLWGRHTRYYIDYVAAVALKDTAGAQAAINGLHDYESNFGAFLASANPYLSADELKSLLSTHVDHLINEVDAYAKGDFDTAYAELRDAYAHTSELSARLAAAITAQFPDRFPDTAIAGSRVQWPGVGAGLVFAALLVALAGVLPMRRRRASRRVVRVRRR